MMRDEIKKIIIKKRIKHTKKTIKRMRTKLDNKLNEIKCLQMKLEKN